MKMAYDYRQDAFYQKETINVTWIMIWNGSTETHWWNPDEYWGTRAYVDGKYQSIDWNNPQHLEEYFHQMRLAGIDVIASDLTNGLGLDPADPADPAAVPAIWHEALRGDQPSR